MRLERLEISGFKSFSERAELAFDQGVTAIVGPNGCGKSNVADAITWVLGEQSAKSLRGEKMEDVIFNGSDARRPGGAAEVRLRLKGLARPPAPGETGLNGNGNGHHAAAPGDLGFDDGMPALLRDVEVTRRLYRSGESEYLIDGEVCRLRDVHELLMDTGLGAKAYAIIEQGKIGTILSSRPTDRRQLIEEAAGITKYKSRRRAAELKLEAAQQNLTRIDDIVFEVEKQRGTLKRQAAKARRYQRLRDELKRWEKVLFARRYRELAQHIEVARLKLADARGREAAAAAQVAEVEDHLGRLRGQAAEADARASQVREDVHARELEINRRQQQQEFHRQQVESLRLRAAEMDDEIRNLDARREPARIALAARRQAAGEAEVARDEAAAVVTAAGEEHARAVQQIEGLEGAVEAARADVFALHNQATTLRHAVQHAAAQAERVGETLGRLDVEDADVRRETEAVERDRSTVAEALARTHGTLDRVRADRDARDADLVAARAEHEERTREVRGREQELAAVEARLASLEELAASRAEFGDAARMVLVQANGRVGQQGAVADYLDVNRRFERAVESCLGDLLQHVIVERHDQAAAGLALVREHDAGRCGFVVIDPGTNGFHPQPARRAPGIVPLSETLTISGPHAATIRAVLPDAYVAESFDDAVAFCRESSALVATLEGDVLRGPHLVAGGAKAEARGILATRREIRELRERIDVDRDALAGAVEKVRRIDVVIADTSAAIAALQAEQHVQEKALVAYEAQLSRGADEAQRLARKADQVALDRRRAEEERAALDSRRAEAEDALARLEGESREAEARLSEAQRRLADARETVAVLGTRAAEAKASHAGLMERAAAIASEILRLEESARELEARIAARGAELQATQARRETLIGTIDEDALTLDDLMRALDESRERLREADDAATRLRAAVDAQDEVIREARRVLDGVRAEAADVDVARVTAENDLGHLAQACIDAVQASLDEVLAEVEQLEASGQATPDTAALAVDESDVDGDEAVSDGRPPDDDAADAMAGAEAAVAAVALATMSAEEAIAKLKGRIDRLGPVNILAIEQFDELEARHAFLTTQRQDLTASIAQTSEAIRRIDETTRTRFSDAFTAIQTNFQETFSTLFGGGRAGLALLDENDPLESGIEIVASPPGKRLQNVQLLSGGEKALTAIALMFAIFKYKPSPFCLLDEIDAPLDDANVGRFVTMLHGMLDRTQFIVITHNRRTMEIADRLYGVTMEEPGVSKLISVQLN